MMRRSSPLLTTGEIYEMMAGYLCCECCPTRQNYVGLMKILAARVEAGCERFLNIRGFDLKRTLEMDPEFLDTDAEHQHDDTVSSLSIVRPGDVHGALIDEWISDTLRTFGNDIFRMKGVLAISGAEQKFVYQAVHMIFDGNFDESDSWKANEPRVNKLVFIGKNLDKEKLTAGFDGCLDTPENQSKILAIQQVKSQERQISMLMQASQRDDVPALKRLVEEGTPVTAGNPPGQTALHIACMWGNYKSVGILISAGAKLDQTNQMGLQTPLHLLAQRKEISLHGRVECAKKMVEAGANLRAKNDEGLMPFEYVAEAGSEELLNILTPQGRARNSDSLQLQMTWKCISRLPMKQLIC